MILEHHTRQNMMKSSATMRRGAGGLCGRRLTSGSGASVSFSAHHAADRATRRSCRRGASVRAAVWKKNSAEVTVPATIDVCWDLWEDR